MTRQQAGPGSVPRRILVYRCGTIGDTIVSIPAIQAIRQAYPEASFCLMTANDRRGGVWADEVLRDFGWFDDFLTYELTALRRPAELWQLIGRTRAWHADLAVHLGSERNSGARLLRDRLFFALAGTTRFVCCPSPAVTFWGRLRRRDAIYPLEVDRLLDGLAAAGVTAPGPAIFELPIAAAHREEVSRFMASTGWDEGRRLIGMCPGSKQPAKRWPEDRYVDIGRRILEETDATIVFVGGTEEARSGERIARTWAAGRWANAAGRLSILETAELLRRCDLYVGNDTGAMHLAAAVGTRCVAIFAARCPERSWHPYGDHHVVLRRHVPCRNCYLTTCTTQQLRCLTEIAADDVWAACQQMFQTCR